MRSGSNFENQSQKRSIINSGSIGKYFEKLFLHKLSKISFIWNNDTRTILTVNGYSNISPDSLYHNAFIVHLSGMKIEQRKWKDIEKNDINILSNERKKRHGERRVRDGKK